MIRAVHVGRKGHRLLRVREGGFKAGRGATRRGTRGCGTADERGSEQRPGGDIGTQDLDHLAERGNTLLGWARAGLGGPVEQRGNRGGETFLPCCGQGSQP
ncbi:hypothetical protein [Streptomyces albogriseolus]|uniref:hypothetical protein n=1 Tax=Streptomyces albogriseolus TaxID=1887 RepID=UPI0036750D0E